MAAGRLNYVELPCVNVPAARAFYEGAFGWTLTMFGDDYAATMTGDLDLGLNGDPAQQATAPLAVIEVADLEAAQARVEAARSRAGLDHSRPATIGWLDKVHALPAYQRALATGGPYAYA